MFLVLVVVSVFGVCCMVGLAVWVGSDFVIWCCDAWVLGFSARFVLVGGLTRYNSYWFGLRICLLLGWF